jgi:KUP system potassium uptake protein
MSPHTPSSDSAKKHGLAFLTLGALGVVYGDIGTSPLYAFKECFHGPHALPVTAPNVLGILSLVFWSLILVISVKYLLYVMRADNRGEGGILALMALARSEDRSNSWLQLTLVSLGLFGSALLYGDGIITPAITTLSAMEGLDVVTHAFHPFILPLTVVVLIVLFAFQRRGTAGIGAVFGPVMVVWFAVIAVLGLRHIVEEPAVLMAANPIHALRFFVDNRWLGFLALGSVFLVVTGGEALYADMGHFGRRPIQMAWFWLVLPALLLNYFGQGSLLLRQPAAAENPFYHLAPDWFLIPLTVLATAAAVIASQAVISGAFSLTRQAVQLGYTPRVDIVHTSRDEIGQIYIPGLNWLLMLATIGLVLGFRSSSALAAAYGVAVTSTMVITTLLAYVVARKVWGQHPLWAGLVTAVFLVIDVSFFAANATKILQGGWLPLVVAALIFLVMMTWKRGREILRERLASTSIPVGALVADSGRRQLARVPGTAIFLSSDARSAPIALLHNVKHNRVLHEKNVFLTVQTEEIPHVPRDQRVKLEELGNGFWSVIVRYGFMEDPHLPRALRQASELGLDIDPQRATYFLSRNTVLPSKRPGMALWRERLFVVLSRNASRPTQFFRIPPNRVIELGMQVEL